MRSRTQQRVRITRSTIADREGAYGTHCLDWYDSCDCDHLHERAHVVRSCSSSRDQSFCCVCVNFANDHSNASALASSEAAFTRSAHLRHREDDNVTTLRLSPKDSAIHRH